MITYVMKSIATLTLFVLPIITNAAVPSWTIVPGESTLSFTATQNDAPITGKFTKFTGEINVDPNQLDTSNVHIIVDTSSISTAYSDLTTTLVTSDWFNTKVFPQAEFKSTKLTKTGDKTYTVAGNLTVRDKTVPVTLTLTEEKYTPTQGSVQGSTTLKRSDFGVGQGEWSDTKEVKDEVTVNFTVSATKK